MKDDAGRIMEIRGKNTNTKRVNEPRGNQVFINNNCLFFSYKSPFIGYGDEE